MTVARSHAHTILLDEKIYVMGGCDFDRYYSNWIEVFDVKTQSWTALSGLGDDELCNHLHQRYQFNVFGGKLYLAVGDDKEYTYEPKSGTWKLVRETMSSILDVIEALCEMGNVTYCCTDYGYLMWSSFGVEGGGEWREIQGLEKLLDHPKMGLKTGYEFALVDCGGKLLVMWHQGKCVGIYRNRIWYAKNFFGIISRCSGRELWGNVECVNVLTFPVESFEWFYCVAALV